MEKRETSLSVIVREQKCITCPYGNGAGTCFGFCIKQILQEQKEGKKQYEQTEEEEKDG